MTATSAPASGSQRLLILDSLRGFALLGIMITHSALLFGQVNYADLYSGTASRSDIILYIANNVFFLGKFFAIFAFLFGLSFFIQMDNGAKKGINFKWRFLWRISILLVIGLIHSLLFSGDILLIYALLAIPLVLLFKVGDKVLMLIIIVLLSGAPRFIEHAFQKSNVEENKPMYGAHQVYENGSLTDVINLNLKEGIIFKIKYQLGVEGRAYQTMAMFLLGLIVGRRRYFEKLHLYLHQIRRLTKWSFAMTAVLLMATLVFYALSKGDISTGSFLMASTFHNWFNLVFASAIVASFILLYQQRQGFRQVLEHLAPYGKMGLSNYLMQSLILIPLIYGFGLGWGSHMNLLAGALIGIVVYALQVLLSKWWLTQFNYGPFEWLWRSATWLKWQPMVRHQPKSSAVGISKVPL
jgi:uncharacterized protein